MDSKNDSQKSKDITPKKNVFLNKKIAKKRKKALKLKNPTISHFTYDSFFIYDQNDYINYFDSLSNKNLIKINSEEVLFLKSLSNSIEIEKYVNNNENFISLDKTIFSKINTYYTVEKMKTPLILYLEKKLNDNSLRTNLSCRKLSQQYFNDTGLKAGKSTINKILKKNFGLHYLKTTIKNGSLKTSKGILLCLCFIKILTKCLKLNFEPIFIDESKIELCNNHFKTWRLKYEEINFGNSSRVKSNLILAVGKNKVYYYKILTENCTAEIFLQFLVDLEGKLEIDKNKKYVYILDNCSVHKTHEIITYLVSKKRNVIFTAPYNSCFNCVELSFRAIKRITYQNIYDDIQLANNDIIKYLGGEDITKTLYYNFCETINQYISYSEKYIDLNLNNIHLNP